MLNIIVCYKWVLDEQDIKVNPERLDLDTSRAKYKISDYDKNALEEAVLLAEKYGGKVSALTFGPEGAKQSLKDALSRGPERAFIVKDNLALTADAFVTANVLAAAIRRIGEYDLILCGEGAADTYAQQVGPRLAALLGIPGITFVNSIGLDSGQLLATRKLKSCTQETAAPLPALVTVLPEINQPRIPSLKQVLGAAKKPVTEISLASLELAAEDLVPRVRLKALKGYAMNRKHIIFGGAAPAEAVAKLVASLGKEGVI